MKATLASSNPHKALELARVLPGWEIEALDADYPEEVGESFEEIALAKARFGRTLAPADHWVLADDSGIEVAALDGAPGIYSARWAAGDWVGKLLAALEGERDRRARYVAALAAISPSGEELVVRGTLDGRVAEAPAGSEGFGYDPLFVPDGETRTAAALGDAWKAEHSHRTRAARKLLEHLGTDDGTRRHTAVDDRR
jgi:XTP/dITP diphosphohydrolase